jgi:hypothetical protein
MKNLNDIKKVCVFDFDQTLMITPLKQDGVEMWEEYYGEKYPSKSWWSESYSLDLDVYKDYIKPNKSIYFDYLTNIKKTDTWVIMLTHRLPKLKEEVNKVLNKFNIKFDDQLFRRSYFLTKADDLDEYIVKFKNLKEIEIWEDREKEINIFKDWAYKVEPWLNIDITINEIKL